MGKSFGGPFEHTDFKLPSMVVTPLSAVEFLIHSNELELYKWKPSRRCICKLTLPEREALHDSRERQDIIINSEDKCSAVVIMDGPNYQAEGHQQLADQNFY